MEMPSHTAPGQGKHTPSWHDSGHTPSGVSLRFLLPLKYILLASEQTPLRDTAHMVLSQSTQQLHWLFSCLFFLPSLNTDSLFPVKFQYLVPESGIALAEAARDSADLY